MGQCNIRYLWASKLGIVRRGAKICHFQGTSTSADSTGACALVLVALVLIPLLMLAPVLLSTGDDPTDAASTAAAKKCPQYCF